MWSVSFNFHERFEIVTPVNVASMELGQVAFHLLALDSADAAEVNGFLETYRCGVIFHDGKKVSADRLPAILPLEQAILRQFVKTVLLVPPSERWAVDVPPSKRLAVFCHLNPHRELIRRRFERIIMTPSTTTRREVFGWKKSRIKEQLEEWSSAWEKREEQPDLLKQVLTEWESYAWRYRTNDLLAIPWLELHLLAEHNIFVRECPSCRRYFVPRPVNTMYCSKCRQDGSRQRNYWQQKWMNMSDEEKEAKRKRDREHKRLMRQIKRLHAEGYSGQEIARLVGKEEWWVQQRLRGKRSSRKGQ